MFDEVVEQAERLQHARLEDECEFMAHIGSRRLVKQVGTFLDGKEILEFLLDMLLATGHHIRGQDEA